MSRLSAFVTFATSKDSKKKKNNKVPLTVRVDPELKAQAQALFGKKMGQLLEAALQDAIDAAAEERGKK
jgi:hypothetical protein